MIVTIKPNSQTFNLPIKLFALIPVIIFFIIGYFVLAFGHPNEDAFILFLYSENLANSGTISYFQNGPAAEGATDFLWMLMISFLYKLGLTTGISAVFLNSIGVYLTSYLLILIARKYEASNLVNLFIIIFVPISNLTIGSYGGFSVSLYSALIGIIIAITIWGTSKQLIYIPILGLILSLFRPDGVIIGVLSSLSIYYFINKEDKKKYFLILLTSGLIGFAYFIWRWNYFGEFLPLPLMVKSSTDTLLPGLNANLKWLIKFDLFIFLGISSIFLLKTKWKRLTSASIPIFIYLFSIIFVLQSQNFGWRFQAPIAILILIGSVVTLSSLSKIFIWKENSMSKILISIFTLLISFQVLKHLNYLNNHLKWLTNDDYINFFPYHLGKNLNKETTIALTEAGRLAYWMPGKKYDLVGLNTVETAKNGSSLKFLKNLNPDLIMFHHAKTIPSIKCDENKFFCKISPAKFSQIIKKDDTLQFLNKEMRIYNASAVVSKFFLENFEDYNIYNVKYGGNYYHLYGVKKDGNINELLFREALNKSFDPEMKHSYLKLKKRLF